MAQTQASRGPSGDRSADLPDRIEALLQARLDATGAGRGIAEVAAVIGREFTIDVLEAALDGLGPKSPLHTEAALPALRLLERAGLVEPDGPGRMRFCHSLVRDAAYAMQLRSERPARHRAVADAITALRGPDAEPEALAAHHEQAGDRHLAAAAHLRAATNAANIAEFGLALTHLRCATDLLGDVEGAAARRLELTACMQIGAAYAASFSYFQPEAVDAYRRALELCDVIASEEGDDDPGLLLPLIAALGGLWSKEVVAGDMVAAGLVTDRLERVLDKAEGLDPEVHRFSLSCRGLELMYQGRNPQAVATLRSAALLGHAGPISLSMGTPHDFVAVNDGILAVALTVFGDDAGAEAALAEALARTKELAFPVGPFSEAVVQLYKAYLHRLRREVDEARIASERVGEIGDQYGFQEHSMLGQMLTLVAATIGGDDAARGALGLTLTAWKMAGGGLAVPVLLAELAEAHLAAGDVDAARQTLDEAAAVVEATDQRAADPEILRLRALADARSGAADATVIAALVIAAQVGLAQGAVRMVARTVMDLRDIGGGKIPIAAAEVARRLRSEIPSTAGGELRELAGWLSEQD